MATKTRTTIELMKQKAANKLRKEWEKESNRMAEEHAAQCMRTLMDVMLVEATWAVWTRIRPTPELFNEFFACLSELIEEHGREDGLISPDWGVDAFRKQLEEEAGITFKSLDATLVMEVKHDND